MQYDVVIVGAGLTGAAAATALHGCTGSIAVIDARDIKNAGIKIALC